MRPGTRVEAKFRGGPRWFAGKIVRANRDGSYDIEYDDGDFEKGVEERSIRVKSAGDDIQISPRTKTAGASSRGPRIELLDKIDAQIRTQRDKDRFLQGFEAADRKANGTIHARDLGRVLKSLRIDFNPGDLREAMQTFGDGRTTVDYQQLLAQVGPDAKGGGGGRRKGLDADESGEEPLTGEESLGALQRGDRVEARYKNGRRYFPGVIERVNRDGSFDIAYDDGDTEPRVRPSFVRKIESEGSAMSGGGRGRASKDEEAAQIADMLGTIQTTEKTITDLQDSFEMLDQEATGTISAREFERNVERARLKIPFSVLKDVSTRLGTQSKVRYGIFIKALRLASGQSGRNSPKKAQRGGGDMIGDGDVRYRPGQRIEARYKNGRKYFPGVIERERPDGSYDIMYDDGDTETRVAPSLIRASMPTVDSLGGGETPQEGPAKGDRVEARFKGGRKYFKGTVQRAHPDGSCDIAYDDGDFERRVAPAKMRVIESSTRSSKMAAESDLDEEEEDPAADQGPLRRGDRVEALYKRGKKWYPGTVQKVYASGACDIAYDDGDAETRVPTRFVRRAAGSGGSAGRPARGSASRGSPGLDTEDEDDGETLRGRRRAQGRDASLQRGSRVEARFRGGGKWFKGKVMRANPDGTFAISYDDGDRELKVAPHLVRPLEAPGELADDGAEDCRGRGGRSGKSGSFRAGQKVEAQFRGGRKFYAGTIARVNRDGTYAIDYADGDRERAVDASKIRAIDDGPGGVVSGDESELDEPLQRGDQVEARYKGGRKYYKGKIMRVNVNGTYDIAYEDGDRERGVRAESVRRINTEQEPARGLLRVGTAVEARFRRGKKWYKGKITRAHADETYDIHYADGDRETRVPSSLVRSLEDSPASAGTQDDDASRDFERGDRIEALFKGGKRYYKGKIARKNPDGTYAILYDDGDREMRVARSKIRSLDEGGVAGGRGKSSSPRQRRQSDGFESTEDERDPEIQRGDRVEARFRGGRKYFKGKVMRVNHDGSFDIAYDDGDRDRAVIPQDVRKLAGSPTERRKPRHDEESDLDEGRDAPLRIGSRVEAKFRGGAKFYKGKVTRVHADGSADIAYDDGDRERMVSPSKIRNLDAPGDEDALEVGDVVEARYRGGAKWYRGKITRANGDGTFDIAFDDGDRERNVVQRSIRKVGGRSPRKSASHAKRGDRVEARFKNGKRFYKGVVDRAHPDGSCDIKYEDGDFERRVKPENIKVLSSSSGSRSPRRRQARDPETEDDDDADATDADDALHEGDRVEARYKGGAKYFPGKITRVNRDGSCAILYDDGDRELRVKRNMIRSKGRRSASQSRSRSPRKNDTRRDAMSDSEDEQEDGGAFRQGERIEARFKGKGKFYKGKITRVRANGTYDINYDDGDRETHVESRLIRRPAGSRPVKGRRPRPRDSDRESEDGEELAALLGRICKKGFRSGAMRNYQEVFDSFDVDGDGYVSRIELGHALDKLGLRYSSSELRSLVNLLDRNGDGRLSYREFVQILKRHSKAAAADSDDGEASSDDSDGSRVRSRRARRSPRRSGGPSRSHSPRKRRMVPSRSPSPSPSEWSESDVEGDDAWDSDAEDALAGGIVVRNFENYVGKILLKDTRKRFKTVFERADSHGRGYLEASKLQRALGKLGIRKRISGNLQAKLVRKYGRETRSKIFYRDLVAGCKEAASGKHDDESHAARMGRILPRLKRAIIEHDVEARIRERFDKNGDGFVERKALADLLAKVASIKRTEKPALLEFLANFLAESGSIKFEEVIEYCRNFDPVPASAPRWKRATSNVDIQKGIAALRAERERMEKEGVDPLVFQVLRKLQHVVSDALSSGAASDYSQVFELFDLDKDGIVSHEEMSQSLAKLGFELSEEEVTKVLARLDADHKGRKMDYRHFLMFVTRGSDRDQWALSASGALVGTTSAGEMESAIRQKLRKMAMRKRTGYSTILKAFKNIDKDGKGYVNKRSLRKVASNQGWALTHEDIACLCARFDLKGEDRFAYKQFVSFLSLDDDAVYGVEQRLTQFVASMAEQGAGVRECFNLFDRNGDGKVSAQELVSAMLKIGFPVSQEEAVELIRRVDVDRDGKIGFAEFARAFGSTNTAQAPRAIVTGGAGDENSRVGDNRAMQPAGDLGFLGDWTESLLVPHAKMPLAAKGSVGEWIEKTASPLEKRNFFAFLHLISSFEKRLGLQQHDQNSSNTGKDDLVLQLGTRLKISMKFLTS